MCVCVRLLNVTTSSLLSVRFATHTLDAGRTSPDAHRWVTTRPKGQVLTPPPRLKSCGLIQSAYLYGEEAISYEVASFQGSRFKVCVCVCVFSLLTSEPKYWACSEASKEGVHVVILVPATGWEAGSGRKHSSYSGWGKRKKTDKQEEIVVSSVKIVGI